MKNTHQLLREKTFTWICTCRSAGRGARRWTSRNRIWKNKVTQVAWWNNLTMIFSMTNHAGSNRSRWLNSICNVQFTEHRANLWILIINSRLTVCYTRALPNTRLDWSIKCQSHITNVRTRWWRNIQSILMNFDNEQITNHRQHKQNGKKTFKTHFRRT